MTDGGGSFNKAASLNGDWGQRGNPEADQNSSEISDPPLWSLLSSSDPAAAQAIRPLVLRLNNALSEQARLNESLNDVDLVDECPDEWVTNEKELSDILEALTALPAFTLEAVGWKALCHQRSAELMGLEDSRLTRLAASVVADLSAILPAAGRRTRDADPRNGTVRKALFPGLPMLPQVNSLWRSGRRSHAGE